MQYPCSKSYAKLWTKEPKWIPEGSQNEDKYGKQILRISAYGTSTTDESISDEDHTLFQVTFEDKPVSRLPIIGFLIVVAIVAGFVLRSTRSELSDL